ncbi:MAG: O-antigen ligase family protein, partial [Frankia sp.]
VLAGTRLGPAGHPAAVASVPAWPGATGAPVPPQLRPFRWFTPALLVILTGYMFFGRSFAYVGIPGTSIFIGEMVFALGVIEAVKARRVIRARFVMSPPFRVLAVFIALCAIRLLVDLPKYRMGAVRDAAIGYYPIYAFLVAAAVMTDPGFVHRLLRWYVRVFPFFLLWVPFSVVLSKDKALSSTTVLGSSTPINTFVNPVTAVLTAMALTFLWLGLRTQAGKRTERRTAELFVILGILGLLMLWSQARTALLTVTIVCGITLLFVGAPRRRYVLLHAFGSIALLVAIALMLNLHANVGGRQVSVGQATTNILSLVNKKSGGNEEAKSGLQGTVSWRKQYEEKIIKDSLVWKHAFTGQGFGPVLSRKYALGSAQAAGAEPLRNAHNSYVTILARTGLPGLGLWILMWIAWFRYVGGLARTRRRGNRLLPATLAAWLVAGVAGFMTAALSDPTFEGPQGAIWAWTLVGLGAAETAVFYRRPGRGEDSFGVPRRPATAPDSVPADTAGVAGAHVNGAPVASPAPAAVQAQADVTGAV